MTHFPRIISFFFVFSVFLFSACSDDDLVDEPDAFPPVDRGDLQANRFLLTFYEFNDTNNRQTVEFFDPDGLGGADPLIQEELVLRKPTGSFLRYDSEIRIFNGNTEITDQIIERQNKYIICYRNYDTRNLRGGGFDKDTSGLQLGITGEWSTLDRLGNDGTGMIRVTLNYYPLIKDGLCDTGFRILEGSIPYQIN